MNLENEAVLALRFLTGLCQQGLSMGDIHPASQFRYVLGIWCLGATAILGPVIGDFAAQAASWRWPISELIWISAIALIVLALFLSETHEPAILILLRPAQGEHKEDCIQPLILSVELALTFANVYLGFPVRLLSLFFDVDLPDALFHLWFAAFSQLFHSSLRIYTISTRA
ncbi:hypothetical protein FB45DRAFT_1086561 [Roridomyces roridus]|uniref:Major facilitator superfamily (MFS) profile domain-containing protein n=1 Tax=Roridomyces roridus TaxID=1738132 RepID=A0AAD7FKS3_9AGAR|nr:hypothetical protein FB45DRAFT_1086561 [Roridomyces roridus]